jgi:hypothetical protein
MKNHFLSLSLISEILTKEVTYGLGIFELYDDFKK